ncbi:hypothetical protein ScPMuIL_009379 [Solemya velum]
MLSQGTEGTEPRQRSQRARMVPYKAPTKFSSENMENTPTIHTPLTSLSQNCINGKPNGLLLSDKSEINLHSSEDETTFVENADVTVPLLGSEGGTKPDEEVIETTSALEESSWSIALQVFIPFIIAGFGTVGAGMVLDIVQHWDVFQEVSEVFILVPALLGLKGNLEMTLASRLSTQANLGNMEKRRKVENDWRQHGPSTGTSNCAALASFILGTLMVIVVLLSKKLRINPDNVATPIAASLGDLTTLSLLAWISMLLYNCIGKNHWLAPSLVGFFILLIPLWIILSIKNKYTNEVVYSGWTPVLSAMVISSIGGLILDFTVANYHGIAVFQPVINGVGGNLVAVQASRISTSLHKTCQLGVLPEDVKKGCGNPIKVFFSNSLHSRATRVLMFLVIPGHLIFIYTISYMKAGHTSITLVFAFMYILAACIQVVILLYVAHWMVHFIWLKGEDPDNVAIPYLTALGDLLGTAFLALAFHILFLIGDRDSDVGE